MANRNINNPFDALDYQIIQALRQDARVSASDIARKVNANERTIRKRIDRLVELGAVRLTAVVDPRTFGYIISVDIFLEVDPSQETAILEQFKTMPHITYIAFGEGSKDLSIEARFKDSAEMSTFLRHTITKLPGVTVKGHALVPAILRNIDEWMPPRNDFGIDEDS
jgi:DNA-binding Lrp family transcriptional regulator